jgi:hypothetical protein
MRVKGLAILVVACLAVGVLSYDASADGRNPGSCLLYPFYNSFNPTLNVSVMTITNTGDTECYVRLVWVDGYWFPPPGPPYAPGFCSPADRWITLSPNDTFTFTDQAYNPEAGEVGFMYAYAVDAIGSTHEVEHNYLIGQEIVFLFGFVTPFPGGIVAPSSFDMNAVAFSAHTITADGLLRLDGTEYDAAPSSVYFPRFFGQAEPFFPTITPGPLFWSWVILINLTGGQWFEQEANVIVYNDNEEGFSGTRYFPCWEFNWLATVSDSVFQNFLLSTNHDPEELFDGSLDDDPFVLGDEHLETGWIEFTGLYAWNPASAGTLVTNPSMYAVLIENTLPIPVLFGFSDLPWQVEDVAGGFVNGSLWSQLPTGP